LVPVLNEGLSGYQGDHETLLDELFTTPLKVMMHCGFGSDDFVLVL
jgi:hypothetical protein